MAIISIHRGYGVTIRGKRYTPAYACSTKKEATTMANRARKKYQQNARIIKRADDYIVYVN